MTIPFGSRRLVLTLVSAPRQTPAHPAAAGASDQELARLARPLDADAMRDQLTATALMYRVSLH
jgi:hypothetical protein